MIGGVVVAGLSALTALVVVAGPALAHVEVQPGTVPAGEPATFSFRVPNEAPAASVTVATSAPAAVAGDGEGGTQHVTVPVLAIAGAGAAALAAAVVAGRTLVQRRGVHR